MNRRRAIRLAAAATAGLGTAVGPASARQALSEHRHALEVARLQIQATGERYKASGRSDERLKQRLAAQARTFARHHRALAKLETT